MEKIYNNLTIDNLVKTDWINQFRKTQQREIAKGYVKKVNILVYAKKKYSGKQMAEIRKGLEDNLDVSVYANSNLSWREMSKIKKEMREIRNEQNIQ